MHHTHRFDYISARVNHFYNDKKLISSLLMDRNSQFQILNSKVMLCYIFNFKPAGNDFPVNQARRPAWP